MSNDTNWLREINFNKWLESNPNGTREEYNKIRAEEDARNAEYKARLEQRQIEVTASIISLKIARFIIWVVVPVLLGLLGGWLFHLEIWRAILGVYVFIFMTKLIRSF